MQTPFVITMGAVVGHVLLTSIWIPTIHLCLVTFYTALDANLNPPHGISYFFLRCQTARA